MDLLGLLGAAFLLGLTGGIHCLAMCTSLQRAFIPQDSGPARTPRHREADPAASAGVQPLRFVRSRSDRPAFAGATIGVLLQFHAARIFGYALLGAALAGASATLRWSAEWAASLRTLWILLNAAVLSLGLVLALRGAMPAWIDGWSHKIWRGLQSGPLQRRRHSVALIGLAWALLPCGLLAGALALALLASDALRGAAVMASFGLGTAIDLIIAQLALHSVEARIQRAGAGWQRAGIRLAGLMLAMMAAIALWAIALGQPHPFCGPR